jgi:hypothetical protein
MSENNTYKKFVWQAHDLDIPEETCTTTYEWDYQLNDVVQVENFVPRINFPESDEVYISDYEESVEDPLKCMYCDDDAIDEICIDRCCRVCLTCKNLMESNYSDKNVDAVNNKCIPITTLNGCRVHFEIIHH